ncbi:OmpA family protein [Tsuneonella mangrovi]|uniref:OmpA family protein n=1 Tax=Tsuneonella mangrovi TaxID=1982042 RepID=UPI000BA1E08A|nr:OmpA family protein [Tsuneonella mangrovi]
MSVIFKPTGVALLCAAAAVSMPLSASAQQQDQQPSDVVATVHGTTPADLSGMPEGPEVDGFISDRLGDKMEVTQVNGTKTTVLISQATEVKASGGFLGISKQSLGSESLLSGLPVAIKTVQWNNGLIASEVKLKAKDLKTATMIHTGTAARFGQQDQAIGENKAGISRNAALAESLRGRMADIDKYNIKDTTNVFFDTGKWNLSPKAESDLCAAASEADGMNGALLLVVGYTDSVGSEDYNQILSERRAGRVVNYLQQHCGWKPWRMLTPTGMAESDPLADNSTAAGKAQNRRVSVNILVSKSVDGMQSSDGAQQQ